MTRRLVISLYLLCCVLPAQESAPEFADLRDGTVTKAAALRYLNDPERLSAFFDFVWSDGEFDAVPGIAELFTSRLLQWAETDALRTRFRRAALLHPRAGLRRLVLAEAPSTPYEAATRITALAGERDVELIGDHFRSGARLGTEWVATLLDRTERDLDDAFTRDVLYDLAVLRIGGKKLAGLGFEGYSSRDERRPATSTDSAFPIASTRRPGSARVIVGYRYRGEARARATVFVGKQQVGAFVLDRGGDRAGLDQGVTTHALAPLPKDTGSGILSMRVEGAEPNSFEFYGCAFVEDFVLAMRPRGRRIPLIEGDEVAVELSGAEASRGWRGAIVVRGDRATIAFDVPEDTDLAAIRTLHLDHWSLDLTGWRTELDGEPFIAFTSQPMPRPARVPRLKRGSVKHGRNVLVLHREQGRAPLHLETLWLWP